MIILFRSDTRNPKEIFLHGFSTKRSPLPVITPVKPFDSDTCTSIALSANLEVTPFFPTNSRVAEAWIYLVAIDDTQSAKHYLDLHRISLSMHSEHLEFTLPFIECVKEKNVIHIPAQNVLCAFNINRKFENVCLEGKTIPFCDTFVIQSPAIMNTIAKKVFENEPSITRKMNCIVEQYNAKVGQQIDVARPKPKYKEQLKKSKKRNAFFVMNRLEPLGEYKEVSFQAIANNTKVSKGFLKSAALRNSSGLLYSSENQICKQNSLFYAAIENGFFDHTLQSEEKNIEECRLKAKMRSLKGCSLENNRDCYNVIYGEEIPTKPMAWLWHMARDGYLQNVNYILKHRHINVNHPGEDGTTPLLIALMNGHFDVVEALLKHPDICVTPPNHREVTPLQLAENHGRTNIIAMIKLCIYIETLKERIKTNKKGENHCHRSIFKKGGFTDGQKLAAAEMLRKVINKKAGTRRLKDHELVLNSGRLKKIFSEPKNMGHDEEKKHHKRQ